MTGKPIRVVWSDDAKLDLKKIYKRIKEKTKSIESAKNVRTDIIQTSKQINYPEQYQVDEFLKSPYRRMVVRHFKIVYKVKNEKEIQVLQVFDTYQSPLKLRK